MKLMNIKPIIFLVVAVIVLGGLFLAFKPQRQAQNPSDSKNVAPIETATPTTSSELETKIFELVIQNKKIVSGPETIKITEGDEITIKITSDETEEFHVHAYDNSVELEPNKQATLTFTANLTGRFPFELEKSKTDLGALEVQPK